MLVKRMNGIKNEITFTNMGNPILTIAIPTYNRPEKLKVQVMAVVKQMTDATCLVVIDNHSDIPVSTLFDEEIKKKVRFIRNRFNMGADGNIAKCFDVCETDWLWTLSDDDTLVENAVSIVLKEIRAHVDSLFINFNKNIGKEISGYRDFAMYAGNNYSDLFWISICVYNLKLLGKYMQYYYSAISTMQPGVALLTKAFAIDSDNKIQLAGQTIVANGDKVISWNREQFLFSTLYLFDYLRHESKILRNHFLKSISSLCFMNIILSFEHDRRFLKALRLYRLMIVRRGLYNSIRYDLWLNIDFLIHLFYYKLFNRHINAG